MFPLLWSGRHDLNLQVHLEFVQGLIIKSVYKLPCFEFEGWDMVDTQI